MTEILSWQLSHSEVFLLRKSSEVSSPELCLHPSEVDQAKQIKAATRHSEYVRARWLLHQSLGPDHNFSREADGLVAWPEPWKGSITHSQGHVAVGLTRTEEVLSIGLDLESIQRVRPELTAKICRPEEWSYVQAVSNDWPSSLARIFAAKEALYKAVYPLGKVQFWFEDAAVVEGSFQINHLRLKVFRDVAPSAISGSEFDVELMDVELDQAPYVVALCEVS